MKKSVVLLFLVFAFTSMNYAQQQKSKTAAPNLKAYIGDKASGTISVSEIQNNKKLTVKRGGILDTTIVVTKFDFVIANANNIQTFKGIGRNLSGTMKLALNSLQKGEQIIVTNIYVKTLGVNNPEIRLSSGIVLTVE